MTSFKFSLSPEQIEKYLAWDQAHKAECPYFDAETGCYATGSIGGRSAFEFAPTSLGTVTHARCSCGKEIDLSDYENW